jgi:hypothetical protein
VVAEELQQDRDQMVVHPQLQAHRHFLPLLPLEVGEVGVIALLLLGETVVLAAVVDFLLARKEMGIRHLLHQMVAMERRQILSKAGMGVQEGLMAAQAVFLEVAGADQMLLPELAAMERQLLLLEGTAVQVLHPRFQVLQ